MFWEAYQTVRDWFGGKQGAPQPPKSSNPAPKPPADLAQSWAVSILPQRLLIFNPAWFVAADDADLVKWCTGKHSRSARSLDSKTASEALRGWLYVAEADATPKLSLLVAGGQPQFVVEHETGRILRRVRSSTGTEVMTRTATRPAKLLPAAQGALTVAVKTGKVPLQGISSPDELDHGPLLPVVASANGKIRIRDALPPADAPDKNAWWCEVLVGDVFVALLDPECRARIPVGATVTTGQEIGRFPDDHVRLPALKSHRPPPPVMKPAPPLVDLGGLAPVAPRLVEKTVREMLKRAGPEASAIMEVAGSLDLDLFVWLMAAGNIQRQRVRTQALKAYPLLIAVMVEEGLSRLSTVTAAIDEKRPLEPALADMLRTSPAALKAAAPLKAKRIGRTRFTLLAQGALGTASRLQPDHLPGRGIAPREREWRVFLDIYDVLRTGRGQLLELSTFTVGGPLWARLTQEQAHGVRGRVQHVADCLHAAWQDLLVPNLAALARQRGRSPRRQTAERLLDPVAAGAILRGGRGFTALEDLARRWDDERATIESAAIRRGRKLANWLPLSESFRHSETGLVVVPLTSTADLESEGKAQQHCLGAAYADDCLFCPVHILSIRRETGERVSTAEVAVEEGRNGLTLSVDQHFGFRNADPSEAAERALEDYLDSLSVGSITVDWGGLYDAMEHRRLTDEELRSDEFPYDVEDEEAADRVFEAWRFILPGQHRKLTRLAWRDAIGLPELLGSASARP